MKTSFQLVSEMNTAFGNAKGDPLSINKERVRNQTLNIFDETLETCVALGLNSCFEEDAYTLCGRLSEKIDFNDKGSTVAVAKVMISELKTFLINQENFKKFDLNGVRDGLTDVKVFAEGGHHLMGIDGDRDMQSVINGVMTRFVKDESDLLATQALHMAKGVLHVYTEGQYPTMILKSSADQPDAPKGKFLKSASYTEPVFYDVTKTQKEKRKAQAQDLETLIAATNQICDAVQDDEQHPLYDLFWAMADVVGELERELSCTEHMKQGLIAFQSQSRIGRGRKEPQIIFYEPPSIEFKNEDAWGSAILDHGNTVISGGGSNGGCSGTYSTQGTGYAGGSASTSNLGGGSSVTHVTLLKGCGNISGLPPMDDNDDAASDVKSDSD